MRDPKTKRGAVRQYNAIIRTCRRDMAGGLMFGMDWPTVRITFPERYARLNALREMHKQLPD